MATMLFAQHPDLSELYRRSLGKNGVMRIYESLSASLIRMVRSLTPFLPNSSSKRGIFNPNVKVLFPSRNA